MTFLDGIEKLRPKAFLIYLSAFSSSLLPGLATLFVLKQGLFVSLETTKLVLLSLAISLPLFLLNFLLTSALDFEELKGDDLDNIAILGGAVLSSIQLYLAVILAHLFALNFNEFLLVVAIIEIAWTVLVLRGSKKARKNSR